MKQITGKQEIISDLEKRVNDKILEKNNFDLLKKLVENADTLDEAIKIAELGTTYKRTGFHFDKRLERQETTINYFKKNNELSFKTDSNAINHKLIIGDNYPALLNLLIEYKGKIDVIYIDPPYGKDHLGEFAKTNYDNAITRDNLLSMLYPRLMVAKQLLSNSGVIFCSIDDKNQAYLKGLFDEIFGESNFTAMNVIETGEVFGTKSAHIEKTFVKVKDYVLIYAKDKSLIDNKQPLFDEARELYDSHYNTVIENDLSKKTLLQFLKEIQWIKELFAENNLVINSKNINTLMKISDKFRDYIFTEVSKKLYADAPFNNGIDISDKLPQEPFIYDNKILFKTATGSLRMYLPFSDTLRQSDDYISKFTRTTIRGDLWKNFHFDMRNVQDEGIIDFKNGKKPIRLIEQLIKWNNENNAIILDFFAGSGTTGHAVLELNKQDGGQRQFILCTNNETTDTTPNGIAIDVTTKRLKRVMTGKCYDDTSDFQWNKKNEPLGDNLDVYDIDEVANFTSTEGKTPFDVIDETLYGQEKFKTVREKVEWVCDNFEGTQKIIENDDEWHKRVEGYNVTRN